jgi:hypothetical protein
VIKASLLNARKIGQKQLEDFVKDRLVLKDEEQSPKIPLLTNQQKQSTNNGILVENSHKFKPISNQVFVCSLWLLCDSLNLLGLHET